MEKLSILVFILPHYLTNSKTFFHYVNNSFITNTDLYLLLRHAEIDTVYRVAILSIVSLSTNSKIIKLRTFLQVKKTVLKSITENSI